MRAKILLNILVQDDDSRLCWGLLTHLAQGCGTCSWGYTFGVHTRSRGDWIRHCRTTGREEQSQDESQSWRRVLLASPDLTTLTNQYIFLSNPIRHPFYIFDRSSSSRVTQLQQGLKSNYLRQESQIRSEDSAWSRVQSRLTTDQSQEQVLLVDFPDWNRDHWVISDEWRMTSEELLWSNSVVDETTI